MCVSGDTGSCAFDVTTDIAISKNQWHHISSELKKDKSVKLYIDGQLLKQGAHSIASWSPTSGDINIRLAIGTYYPNMEGWAGDISQAFNGLIDDVRVYNQSLTASEIQKLYVQGLEKYRDLALDK